MSLRGLRHRIEYAIVLAIRWLVGWMPYPLVRLLGTTIGLTFHVIDRQHRRLAVSQLRAAFPMRSEDECRAILQSFFRTRRATPASLSMLPPTRKTP